MTEDRPVQVDFSVQEARSVAAALDLAAHILDCGDEAKPDQINGDELRQLQERVTNGAVLAELERTLGL